MTRDEARANVETEAWEAGFDGLMVVLIVDTAMSAYDDLHEDVQAFDNMVQSVIEGYAEIWLRGLEAGQRLRW